jgi:hypothetical protein
MQERSRAGSGERARRKLIEACDEWCNSNTEAIAMGRMWLQALKQRPDQALEEAAEGQAQST